MIIDKVITLVALGFNMVANPINPDYSFGAKLNYSVNCPVLVNNDTSGDPCFVDSSISFIADVSYNDSSNFYLSNFQFSIVSNAYLVNRLNGNYSLENTFSYVYKPSWSVTNLNYTNFTDFSINVGVDSEDKHYLIIRQGSTIIDTQQYELDYGNPITLRGTFSFDGSSLINLVSSYIDDIQSNYQDDIISSYQDGYSAGYNDASNQDQVAVAIFTGFCEVGLLPVNVFLGILNFEVFGINIGGFVASLLTVAIVIIIIRMVLGAKSGGSND